MSETTSSPAMAANGKDRRRMLLIGLALIIIFSAVGYGIYYFVHGRWFESTEDAYANGNVVELTPLPAPSSRLASRTT